jgi:hypothetical protein
LLPTHSFKITNGPTILPNSLLSPALYHAPQDTVFICLLASFPLHSGRAL